MTKEPKMDQAIPLGLDVDTPDVNEGEEQEKQWLKKKI